MYQPESKRPTQQFAVARCRLTFRLPERRTALQKYLWIAAGGALGSIARYWIGSAAGSRMGVRFPYGTLIVNVTACVAIGFTISWLGRRADLSRMALFRPHRLHRRVQHLLHIRMGNPLHAALRSIPAGRAIRGR